ncbi:unnamed protein product, partial [Discosporangium mesarthrocarpum]
RRAVRGEGQGHEHGQGQGQGWGLRGTTDAVRVMWESGNINVYRWGVLGPPYCPAEAGRPCFDVKVLWVPPPPPLRGKENARENRMPLGGQLPRGTGPGTRVVLKWTVEEVERALAPGNQQQQGGG